mmetsp:Transcript_173/g.522  ORF Transcript_173/g.522 Transcript_173/m.522 type:complete len:200 (+) Transcript_173:463-1062(+)
MCQLVLLLLLLLLHRVTVRTQVPTVIPTMSRRLRLPRRPPFPRPFFPFTMRSFVLASGPAARHPRPYITNASHRPPGPTAFPFGLCRQSCFLHPTRTRPLCVRFVVASHSLQPQPPSSPLQPFSLLRLFGPPSRRSSVRATRWTAALPVRPTGIGLTAGRCKRSWSVRWGVSRRRWTTPPAPAQGPKQCHLPPLRPSSL